MEKKSKIGTILGFLILAIFIFIYLFTAIRDLVSLGNARTIDPAVMDIREDGISVEGDFYYLSEGPVFSMKHTINGLIPTGTEYYFMLFSNDLSKCIFVRADEGYAEDFYKEVDTPNAEGRYYGAHLKGRIRELDSQIKREASGYINDLQSEGITVLSNGTEFLYLDITTKFQCILRLITAFGLLVATVLIIILVKFKGTTELGDGLGSFKPVGIIAVVLILACVVSMFYTMTFLF